MPDSPEETPDLKVEQIPEDQVVFGDVQPDDGGLFLIDDKGLWEDCYVINRYEKDNHAYMMGITSPNGFQGNSVAFVQLASFTILHICQWTVERIGEKPEMPHPKPATSNLILLDEHYELPTIIVLADSNHVMWRVSGTYVYGFKNPSKAQPVWPRPPWIQDKPRRKIETGDFKAGIRDFWGGIGETDGAMWDKSGNPQTE